MLIIEPDGNRSAFMHLIPWHRITNFVFERCHSLHDHATGRVDGPGPPLNVGILVIRSMADVGESDSSS